MHLHKKKGEKEKERKEKKRKEKNIKVMYACTLGTGLYKYGKKIKILYTKTFLGTTKCLLNFARKKTRFIVSKSMALFKYQVQPLTIEKFLK